MYIPLSEPTSTLGSGPELELETEGTSGYLSGFRLGGGSLGSVHYFQRVCEMHSIQQPAGGGTQGARDSLDAG